MPSRATQTMLKKRRLELAADQLWYHIVRGANLEVPFSLNKDDDYIQAIAILQKKHPEVELRLYQSRGIVLGLNTPGQSLDVSQEAMGLIRKGGGLGTPGQTDVIGMLAEHERWMRSQKMNPEEQERLAQEEQLAKHRIEVGNTIKAPDAPDAPDAVEPIAPVPEASPEVAPEPGSMVKP